MLFSVNLYSASQEFNIEKEAWVTFYPERGEIPENRVEVKVKISVEDILIDFSIISKNIISKNLKRDKRIFGEDEFCIVLTFDKNSGRGFFFCINPLNNQTDARIYNFNQIEELWDEKWFSEVYIKDTLWGGRVRLPLRIFKDLIDTNLYINFSISSHTEKDIEIITWSLIPEGYKNYDLRFTKELSLKIKFPKKTFFSVIPYTAIFRENRYYKKLGSDLKLQRDFLNFQFTINPEYASIEADIDQFNFDKSRVIYLPEKRPFFTEGLDLWRLPFEVFYTRSILDIDAGGKVNLNFKNLNINTFWILEKDTVNKKIEFKNSTYAFRGNYNLSKNISAGIFHIKRKFKEEGYGLDLNFYLPLGYSISSQYTYAKGNDFMLYLSRFGGKGLWINTGFEYLDSLFNLSTTYIAYYKNTFSYWLYSGYTWGYKRVYFPFLSVSAGGTDAYFLDKRLFERYGTFSITLDPFSQMRVMGKIEPGKRYYYGIHYNNLIYRFASAFGVNYPHSIIFITEFGDYYGDYLNYYYINYDFLIFRKLRGQVSYAISRINNDEDRRIIGKLTYNPLEKIFLKIFCQKSTISHREDINFLFQYEFFAGSNIYFVYNHKNIQNEKENLFMAKIAYEFRF